MGSSTHLKETFLGLAPNHGGELCILKATVLMDVFSDSLQHHILRAGPRRGKRGRGGYGYLHSANGTPHFPD